MRVPLALIGALTASAVLGAGVGVAAPRATDPVGLRGFSDCASYAAFARPRMDAAETFSRRLLPLVRSEAKSSGEPVGLGLDPIFGGTGTDADGTTTVAPGAEAPDVAKLDGSRLISLRVEGADADGAGGELTVRVTELGGPDPGERGRLGLPGLSTFFPSGLLVLPDHRVLVAGSVGGREGNAVVALLDASDPARPALVRKETVTGSLSSLWLRDGLVGMLVAARPAGLVPWSADPPDPELPLSHNWTLARPAGAAALLPGREIVDGRGRAVEAGPLLDCAQVWAPRRDSGVGMITVRTLDPTDGDAMLERGQAFGVFADGDVVHAGADRVYVGTARAAWGNYDRRKPRSAEFHAFARTGRAAATYLVSGRIPGELPDRRLISADGHRLRMIVNRGTTYYANETDVFVLAEKKRHLKVVAQRTELWRDQGIGAVYWHPAFAAVFTGSELRRLELHGTGPLSEERLQTVGSISGPAASVGADRILVTGSEVARAVDSPSVARGPYPYLQASVVALQWGEPSPGKKPRPPGWVDKVNLPADVSSARDDPAFLPGLGIVVLVAEGTRTCSAGPECPDGFVQYPTVLGLRVGPNGVLATAGRLDDPGTVQRVLEHDGRVVLLIDEAVLLTGPDLRVRTRIPRAG